MNPSNIHMTWKEAEKCRLMRANPRERPESGFFPPQPQVVGVTPSQGLVSGS